MFRKKNSIQQMDRRRFIKVTASLAALMSMPACLQGPASDRWGKILPTRTLGKTSLKPTIFTIGSGAFDMNPEAIESIIEAAIEGGCRFFETARAYSRGECERLIGQYLTPNYRNEIILMSKTYARDAEAVKSDVETSLESMKTDYVDIYLMHAIRTPEDLEERLTGGVFDALVKAREEGLIGHIGFSGHSDPAANNYFINKEFPDLEVMLVPVNAADPVKNSFILNTLPLAKEKNIGVIAMKVFAGGGFHGKPITWGAFRGAERDGLIPDIVSNSEALHYALSMPIATASIGCTDAEQVRENIANVKAFTKYTDEQCRELVERVTERAMNNIIEHYKSGT
jgi:predicted aldo/keto reductase-like oxidoreductase